MRRSFLALAGLLALAAAVPAAADPVRLDEAALGGVAAGMSLSTSQVSNTVTNLTSTSSNVSSVTQSLAGGAVNTNYSTGMSSENVVATGNAFSSVTGTIAR